jgi:hypothetical protein
VELEPGEVVFTSSSLTEEELEEALLADGWECLCRCRCQCTGAPYIVIPCSSPIGVICEELNGDKCEYGNCQSTLADCKRRWRYMCED